MIVYSVLHKNVLRNGDRIAQIIIQVRKLIYILRFIYVVEEPNNSIYL